MTIIAWLQAVGPGSFMDDLGRLFGRYLHDTLPFAMGHVFIAYTVYRMARQIWREIGALNRWPKVDQGDGVGADALTRFKEECTIWGARGTLVPMTDFSDRLDSSVTGYIESLHARINLFLVVGVAGTFFELFSALAQGVKDVQTVANALPSALPVGFVGLTLTFIGHYVSFALEHRYRDAVAGSTGRAMADRTALARGAGEDIREAISQLSQVLQQSLQPVLSRLEEKITEATQVTSKQIQPLADTIGEFTAATKDLKPPLELMQQSMARVPEVLQHLDQIQDATRQFIQATTAAMSVAQSQIAASSEKLTQTGQELASIPDKLTGVVKEKLEELSASTAKIWTEHTEKVLSDIQPASQSLTSSAQELQKAAQAVEQANSALKTASAELVSSFASANEQLVTACRSSWSEMTGDLKAGGAAVQSALTESSQSLVAAAAALVAAFETQTADLAAKCYATWDETAGRWERKITESLSSQLSSIKDAAEAANAELRRAAGEIDRIGQSVSATLNASLSDLHAQTIQQIEPELAKLRHAVAEDYPKILAALSQSVSDSDKIRNDLSSVANSVKAAAGELDTMNQRLRETNEKLRDVRVSLADGPLRGELTKLTKSVDDLAQSLPALKRKWNFGWLKKARFWK